MISFSAQMQRDDLSLLVNVSMAWVEQRSYKGIGQTVIRHTDVPERRLRRRAVRASAASGRFIYERHGGRIMLLDKSKRFCMYSLKRKILDPKQARVCTLPMLERIRRLTSG
jgi:hypothetical protein